MLVIAYIQTNQLTSAHSRVLVKKDMPTPVDLMAKDYPYSAVKVSQFSWTRLGGADPMVGVDARCILPQN